MVRKFRSFRSEWERGVPMKVKLPYHLTSNRNFRNFWPNGKHPVSTPGISVRRETVTKLTIIFNLDQDSMHVLKTRDLFPFSWITQCMQRTNGASLCYSLPNLKIFKRLRCPEGPGCHKCSGKLIV